MWFMENLFSIIMAVLIIAMIAVMIWRSHVPWSKAGGGASSKSEFNVITAVTLVLIIAASVIALQQQNFAVLIEIGIAVIVYAFIMGRIPRGSGGRNAGHGDERENIEIPPGGSGDVITVGRKRLYLYKEFNSKDEANDCCKSMKKQYGNEYLFRKRSIKTTVSGVVWGVYSDLR